ncbi:transporter substrate-binding domain-containing protein [Paraglaciecola aquimarina]|uniref:Transporter substrate-binding domain-containing protein n=1 Tax=Paraglaciecola aquimarina TaxID=1235557 RepID=A0ABU3SY19_9ALTE|nr:HD domain-containing phosphohydrolase [Paraglaciecola aquimarina]MDU0354904.1 transporter substrate-binding domain-containing protein [Paraglaciecola aquimarina]
MSIRLTVVAIFVIAVSFTAFIAISLQYYFSYNMAVESTTKVFNITTQNTSENLTLLNSNVENTLQVLSHNPELKQLFFSRQNKKELIDVMLMNPSFYAIYIGLSNGDFSEIINLDASPIIRSQIGAKAIDRWVVIDIVSEQSGKKKYTHFYNEAFKKRETTVVPTTYEPKTRMWFSRASEDQVYKTAPYLFQNLQAPGQTYSLKLPNENSVLAIDIALSSLSSLLRFEDRQATTQLDVEMYLFQQDGELISSNQERLAEEIAIPKPVALPLTDEQQALINKLKTVTVSNELDWAPIDFAISGNPSGYSIDILTLVSQMTGLEFNYINGYTWHELVELFKNNKIQVLNSAYQNEDNRQLGLMSEPFLSSPFSIITMKGKAEITALQQLHGKTLAISADWAIAKHIQQQHPEIKLVILPSVNDVLRSVKNEQYYAGIDNTFILQYSAKQLFIDDLQYHTKVTDKVVELTANLHFVLANDQQQLTDIFNLAISHITPAQKQAITKKWLYNSQQFSELDHMGVVPYKELVSYAKAGQKLDSLYSVTIDGQDKHLYLSKLNGHDEYFALLIPDDVLFSDIKDKVKISIIVTGVMLLILLPLCWFFSIPIVNPIKHLAKQSTRIKNRQYDQFEATNSYIFEIDELAKSMQEMSDSIQRFQQDQSNLIDAFIELIAQAIDDKSPYTAGHCKRVPELGMLLAQAASDSQIDAFAQFKFTSEEQIREFKVAAWLHDCGKITVPEHIVDKGTKLETIYNRIHEIRMRFEVLWRDTEITYLTALQTNPDAQAELLVAKQNTQKQLQEDFAFIAKSNVGGEFMHADDIQKLTELSKITWQRYFDNSLGLSPLEELRIHGSDTLPVTEFLLMDKPEHIIQHDKPIHYKSSLGIKITPPEYRANMGELHNLSISRGTLTKEDRFKINEHIISTIKMLDNLPFPEELANVPRYASTHHETLIGTGYPRKLTATDLSIPERVLVLADVFEALTAADRPYKKAKPLSVAINILHQMVLDKHVDADIFKLFLRSKIYLDYCQKFLPTVQIDEVDIGFYLDHNYT